MRTKNKTLAIGGIEPPISCIFVDRTQRPRQTRHRHSLKYKCRKSKYIVVTYINKTIRSHLVY
jgi:membrane-bound inhibitor of C-type lysozyme